MSNKGLIIPDRVAKRAAMAYAEDPNSGCWLSTYSVASHGYSQIGWYAPELQKNVGTLCHRAAWVYHHGSQIPEGMTVDHMCHNRRCVNPAHLRLLSNFENARRTSGRDWPLGQCAAGHSNAFLKKNGSKWACSICRKKWLQRYREKRNASASGLSDSADRLGAAGHQIWAEQHQEAPEIGQTGAEVERK